MADETAQMIPTPSFAKQQRDRRFAMLVDSAVHQAMTKYGRIDPRDANEAAFRIAQEAVVTALTTAFEDDAEPKYTREMLDKVMGQLESCINLMPVPVRLLAD